MAKPSKKSPDIEEFLTHLLGGVQGATPRSDSIEANLCVPTPIGCGKPIGAFSNEVSRREYKISGLCQSCQDSFYGTD